MALSFICITFILNLKTKVMTLKDLNNDQKLQLKQSILVEKQQSTSYGELSNADTLVTDAELEEKLGGTEFVDEDFFC